MTENEEILWKIREEKQATVNCIRVLSEFLPCRRLADRRREVFVIKNDRFSEGFTTARTWVEDFVYNVCKKMG